MSSFKQGKIKFGFLETATSGGTLTLTSSSLQYQILTGTSTHTVQLPNATTMGNGLAFCIINSSTGIVTIKLNDTTTTHTTLTAGQGTNLFLTDNSTSNGSWTAKTGGTAAAAGIDASVNATSVASGNRGFLAGALTGPSSTIDYIILSTLGASSSFGNLSVARGTAGGCGSSTRGVIGGGDTSNDVGNAPSNVIDYITFTTNGNAVNFGTLTIARNYIGGLSNSTRGLFAGGYNGAIYSTSIDYITIASTGNATNFGNLTNFSSSYASFASPTRGIFVGGGNAGGNHNNIEYVTIASTSNTTNFGTYTTARGLWSGCSSSTRGIFGGGYNGSHLSDIQYITIATTGNATSFGNLTVARRNSGAMSSLSRGIFAGGSNGFPATLSVIDYVTIATTSDAASFGTLSAARTEFAFMSDCHGGL